MKADKLRGLNEDEMRHQLREMDEQLFRFHFQKSMGQLEGLKKARGMRKDRARIYTLLREREMEARRNTGGSGESKAEREAVTRK